MQYSEFSARVARGASLLCSLCSTGDPSEQQVIDATKSAGLPVADEKESFTKDPVRKAVFVRAYRSMPGRMVEDAWRDWRENDRPTV